MSSVNVPVLIFNEEVCSEGGKHLHMVLLLAIGTVRILIQVFKSRALSFILFQRQEAWFRPKDIC